MYLKYKYIIFIYIILIWKKCLMQENNYTLYKNKDILENNEEIFDKEIYDTYNEQLFLQRKKNNKAPNGNPNYIVITTRPQKTVYLITKKNQVAKNKIIYSYDICYNKTGVNCLTVGEWMNIAVLANQISPRIKDGYIFADACFRVTVFDTPNFSITITPNFETGEFQFVPVYYENTLKKYYKMSLLFYLIDLSYTVKKFVRNAEGPSPAFVCTSSSTIYF